MVSWQPSQEGIQQITTIVLDLRRPGLTQQQQKEAHGRLQQCAAHPDYNGYLVFLLARSEATDPEMRQQAGLLLKNSIRKTWAATRPELQAFIKESLVESLGVPLKPLRETVATAIGAVIAQTESVVAWPEFVRAVVAALDGGAAAPDAADGALDAVAKVCEETPNLLERDCPALGARPADLLVPRLVALFASALPAARRRALASVNALAPYLPRALAADMDRYVQGLFALAADPSADIRRLVCQGLVQLLAADPDRLRPVLRDVVRFMLRCNQSSDEAEALESCEFWGAFCEANLPAEDLASLREELPLIVPVLLTNMAYSEYDEAVLAADADEAGGARPDRPEDLKPQARRAGGGGGQKAAGGGSGGAGDGAAGGGGDDDEEDGEEDDDDDEQQEWTLRKSSAAGLDMLSTQFGDDLLPALLPTVQARLGDPNWRLRESAVLALGAVADGCSEGLAPFLLDLVVALLPLCADPKPLVRSIACWALSRFAPAVRHAAAGPAPAGPAALALLDELLRAFLARTLDGVRRVQEAACSAVAALAEAMGPELLVPRAEAVIAHALEALPRYQRKPLRRLFDMLSTLAEVAGPALAEPRLARVLFPPLLARWAALGQGDRDALDLLPCIGALARGARAQGFAEFAPAVFARACAWAEAQLGLARAEAAGQPLPQQQQQQQGQGQQALWHDPDMLAAALDVLAAVAEALGPSVESLVAQSSAVELALASAAEGEGPVRESAFALLGDLARTSAAHLAPVLPRFLEACGAALVRPPDGAGPVAAANWDATAANNACWAAGELAVRAAPGALAPFALPLAQLLVPLLAQRLGGRHLVHNAAITLGRLATAHPEPLVPHLGAFVAPWCAALRSIRDDTEKEDAFRGLCALVRRNPGAAAPAFAPLCLAFVSWHTLRDEALHRDMCSILAGFKEHFEGLGQWADVAKALEPAVARKLGTHFAIVL